MNSKLEIRAMKGELIVIETEAFYLLIEEVIQRIAPTQAKEPERWMTPEQTKAFLNIGDTTLYHLRVNDAIRYTQPSRKVILYDRISLEEYLENNAVK